MKTKLRSAYNRIQKSVSVINDYVVSNWVKYNVIKIALLSLLSTFFILFFPNDSNFVFSCIFCMLIPFFLLDARKYIVAETNPKAYITSETIEKLVAALFVIIYVLVYAFSFLILGLPNAETSEYIPIFANLINVTIYLGSGIIFTYLIQIVEKIISAFVFMIRPKTENKFLQFFSNYYIGSRLRTRTRLLTTLSALSNSSSIRTMQKNVQPFKDALNIYNDYLISKFDFAIREPVNFYKYVKFSIIANNPDRLTKIKKSLSSLVNLTKEENENPLEFVKELKTMIGISTSDYCELYSDFEIEPLRFSKQIKDHSDLISIVVTVVASVVIPVLLHFVGV